MGASGRLLAATGDVDFMIHGLIRYKLFGQEFYITTTHVSILIVMAVILIFAIAANRKIRHAKEVPDGFQNIVELIVEMLDKMVYSSMGSYAGKFANYIGTIFIFIFISNISGLFGLRPPTADYGVTLPLGLITFAIIQYNNLKYNKFGAFTGLFKPLPFLFPINLIGEIAVPFSLSLRLFGNVLSGTVMMALIYALLSPIAIAWPGLLHIYFDVFSGAIQTYVFCMLTMVFVTEKLPKAIIKNVSGGNFYEWNYERRFNLSVFSHWRRPCHDRRYRAWYRPGYRCGTRGCGSGAQSGRQGRHYLHHAAGAGGCRDNRSVRSGDCLYSLICKPAAWKAVSRRAR